MSEKVISGINGNQTVGQILKSCVIATLGLMCFAAGIYLIIQANIGAAPWDVFCLGLSNTVGVLYGTASIAISVVVILIDLLMGEKIGLGTILDAIVVGKTVDLLNWLGLVGNEHSLAVSLLMLVIAFILEGFSQYLYMKVGLCCGPRDSLQIGISRRIPKLPIGAVGMMILATVLVIGYFLGGPVGIGTIVAPFGIGFFQQLCFNFLHFEPKDIQHQSIIGSWKVLTSAHSGTGLK